METYDPNTPTSAVSKIKQRIPEAELVPSILPAGPGGERGHRVWGASGGGMVFGAHVAENPKKVIRMLKILEAMVTDIDLYVRVHLGVQGKHWDWADPQEKDGTIQLSPYTDHSLLKKEGYAPVQFATGGSVLIGASPDPVLTEPYLIYGAREFRRKYRKLEWHRTSPIGRPDIIPEFSPVFERLRMLQMNVYLGIIRGNRPLDDFDPFCQDWLDQGGRAFLEANQTFYNDQTQTVNRIRDMLAPEGTP
jgi:putative aldouronate transport system substrate-binding protein